MRTQCPKCLNQTLKIDDMIPMNDGGVVWYEDGLTCESCGEVWIER